MKSLEFATDLLAMRGASVVEHHRDRVVQRTPAEPDFWFGNRVIFTAPPTDAAAALARFHADFPHARHVCIGWDVPNLPLAPVRALFEGTGLTVEQGEVLGLAGAFNSRPPPEGIAFRAFRPDDWAQSHEISLEVAQDDGLPLDTHLAYLEARARTRQAQITAGFCQWFGAFEGDRLVGDMGVVFDADHIRYQVVQTRRSHRRRGIASALLGFALEWAQSRAPRAIPVIVADAEGEAGRIYRRAGFSLMETSLSAWRASE